MGVGKRKRSSNNRVNGDTIEGVRDDDDKVRNEERRYRVSKCCTRTRRLCCWGAVMPVSLCVRVFKMIATNGRNTQTKTTSYRTATDCICFRLLTPFYALQCSIVLHTSTHCSANLEVISVRCGSIRLLRMSAIKLFLSHNAASTTTMCADEEHRTMAKPEQQLALCEWQRHITHKCFHKRKTPNIRQSARKWILTHERTW